MLRMNRAFLSFCLVLILCVGCDSTPDYVISQDKMAQILIDIHTAESVIESNRKEYESDSVKKALKQSIYLKHNVTAEQVDTSFVWYGHNIEQYIEVYDKVISQLEEDIDNVDVSSEDVQFTIAGDSADAWSGLKFRRLTVLSADNNIAFVINSDDNWEKGDVYEWKMKLIRNSMSFNWFIAVDYSDGTSEYITELITSDGWQDITLYSDSTKTASRVYGVALTDVKGDDRVFVDSISLVRTRINQQTYHRRFSQEKFGYGQKENDEK